MADATVPVDLLNPGQVFACLGLMELTELISGPCIGTFIGGPGQPSAMFRLDAAGSADPVEGVLDFLRNARAVAVAPFKSGIVAKERGVPTDEGPDKYYPCDRPPTPSALPIVLKTAERSVSVEHWADESTRDNLKFWAGAGGYSGAALARDALRILADLDMNARARAKEDPFALAAPMKSSFRLDWRRDYIPLDVGFSPNNHRTSLRMVGYPVVELLAVIGLQHARPARVSPRDKLRYRYAVSTTPLPTVFARAVLGGADMMFPVRRFRMQLGWPGQERQARCIVDAQEEFSQ